MKIVDLIADARVLTNDSMAPYRNEDAVFVRFANQTIKRIAVLRPDLFATVADVPTAAGEVLQEAPADALRIMEVLRVTGGLAVIETNREAMDTNYPAWAQEDSGACQCWMRHPRNNRRYFIYPSAPPGQQLVVEYAQMPRDYGPNEDVALLPDVFYPVVLDGMVYLSESVDDEHVNSNRAQMFQQSFTQALGVALQNRVLLDAEDGAVGTAPAKG